MKRNRPQWTDLPAPVRASTERLIGAAVVHAASQPGGFSPGLASKLSTRDGQQVFVKAIDGSVWPGEVAAYRDEARVNALLPADLPAPRLLDVLDSYGWVLLVFEAVDGDHPERPWRAADLSQVLAALAQQAAPAPPGLAGEHPRLGGFVDLDEEALAALSPWAAAHLDDLAELERAGLAAARGDQLVHCDLYPHNILLAADRVVVVDWPHARAGAAVIDQLTLLISAAADGIDPSAHGGQLRSDRDVVDSVLAAHAGFLLSGAFSPWPPGLRALGEEKRRLGTAALTWLQQRLLS
jgi:phosphotransferase family enzyme